MRHQCVHSQNSFPPLLQASKAGAQSHRDTSRPCGLLVSLDTALQLWMEGKNAKKCIPPPHVRVNKKSFPHFPGRGTAEPQTHAHSCFRMCRGSPFRRTTLDRTVLDALYEYNAYSATICSEYIDASCIGSYADALEERSTSRRLWSCRFRRFRATRSDSGRHGAMQEDTERCEGHVFVICDIIIIIRISQITNSLTQIKIRSISTNFDLGQGLRNLGFGQLEAIANHYNFNDIADREYVSFASLRVLLHRSVSP